RFGAIHGEVSLVHRGWRVAARNRGKSRWRAAWNPAPIGRSSSRTNRGPGVAKGRGGPFFRKRPAMRASALRGWRDGMPRASRLVRRRGPWQLDETAVLPFGQCRVAPGAEHVLARQHFGEPLPGGLARAPGAGAFPRKALARRQVGVQRIGELVAVEPLMLAG